MCVFLYICFGKYVFVSPFGGMCLWRCLCVDMCFGEQDCTKTAEMGRNSIGILWYTQECILHPEGTVKSLKDFSREMECEKDNTGNSVENGIEGMDSK